MLLHSMHWHWRRNHRFTEQLSTGAYYPPVVTAGRFLLPEHPTVQRGHCALQCIESFLVLHSMCSYWRLLRSLW